MKKCFGPAALVIAFTLIASTAMGAVDPDPAMKKTFDKMLGAIQANDLDAFVAEGVDEVKKGITQEIMDTLSKQVGTRLKKGHKATYFGQVKQAGHQVHLWKLTFKDDGDDIVVRLALKDGKVGGFVLQ